MSTSTASRRCLVKENETVCIVLPNGVELLVTGSTVSTVHSTIAEEIAPVVEAAVAPVVEVAPIAPAAAPATVRKGRKGKAKGKAAPDNAKLIPGTEEAAAVNAAAAEASLRDGSHKSNARKEITSDKFKGVADYWTHDKQNGDCWKEVAIISVGKGEKPALLLAYPHWDAERKLHFVPANASTFRVSQFYKKDGEFVLDAAGNKQPNPKLRGVDIW